MFSAIKWRIVPDPDEFFRNLSLMALDILHAGPNSIAK